MLGDTIVKYELQIKNVKRINLRVHRDGRVSVSANKGVAQAQINAFLETNADFILNTMERFEKMRKAGDGMAFGKTRTYHDGDTVYLRGEAHRLLVLEGKKETVELLDRVIVLTQKDTADTDRRMRMMNKFLKDSCQKQMGEICENVFPQFQDMGVEWPEIRVRNMTARWGSCQPAKGILTFAQMLVEVPLPCMEYVAVHEFAHFIHPDHSPRFHAFMTERMPDWKERRELLNSRAWVKT